MLVCPFSAAKIELLLVRAVPLPPQTQTQGGLCCFLHVTILDCSPIKSEFQPFCNLLHAHSTKYSAGNLFLGFI